ncbi:hypothetical protein V4C85_18425 [Ralstonia solanacearum]|uniref:hypothetical protein n=1 Tax=Ralstonia solanacearum TaxID=305 RepID=UPI001E45731C|nr:hypothetical protein [Ralstonia solanacearum]
MGACDHQRARARAQTRQAGLVHGIVASAHALLAADVPQQQDVARMPRTGMGFVPCDAQQFLRIVLPPAMAVTRDDQALHQCRVVFPAMRVGRRVARPLRAVGRPDGGLAGTMRLRIQGRCPFHGGNLSLQHGVERGAVAFHQGGARNDAEARGNEVQDVVREQAIVRVRRSGRGVARRFDRVRIGHPVERERRQAGPVLAQPALQLAAQGGALRADVGQRSMRRRRCGVSGHLCAFPPGKEMPQAPGRRGPRPHGVARAIGRGIGGVVMLAIGGLRAPERYFHRGSPA